MLTMGLQDLAAQAGATRTAGSRTAGSPLAYGTGAVYGTGVGRVLGSRAAGTPLAPDTARKIACDAGVIPVVLGGASEILDQGRAVRLFTTGQVRALWLRDGHCTFDGCDIPAAWCDSHVRREALIDRVEVRDLHRCPVAAG